MHIRMVKIAASCVLASFGPSTYSREHASAPYLLRPCWTAILTILQEIGKEGPS